jgi:DnaJ family protein A protein 5
VGRPIFILVLCTKLARLRNMGAGQSRNADGVETEIRTSYYELLGVQRQATDEEIKKAYRRKALELHPDRNYGHEEAATKTFAEVQAAYEVLSDPQERAWYDSHESAILRGDDGAGQDEAPTYQNVRVTTADDLARMVRKFNSNVAFSDAPSGFFGFIRETFDQLAKEEEIAGSLENVDVVEYPPFGHKDDGYDDVVKQFYSAWSNFSTVKAFAWKDKYKLSEAPDRWYRRRMEQENKALRREGIKEFNEAVRSLVAFVRKRDPRYIPSTQSEAERQKVLRDAAAAQAARARAANLEKLNSEALPEWTKIREPEDLEESEEEETEQEVFECVACNKVFKSEKQWEAHEKSKKHQKAVYALQKKMRRENAHLDIQDGDVSSGFATPRTEDDEEEQEMLDDMAAEVEDHEVRHNGDIDDEAKGDLNSDAEEVPQAAWTQDQASERNSASDDSDYASPEVIRARMQETSLDTPPTTVSEADDVPEASEEISMIEQDEDATQEPSQPKIGKAAQKRAKKAAAATSSEQPANTQVCASCNAAFPSKTRLFQHLKDHPLHSALKPASSGTGGKGKKAKGKR